MTRRAWGILVVATGLIAFVSWWVADQIDQLDHWRNR